MKLSEDLQSVLDKEFCEIADALLDSERWPRDQALAIARKELLAAVTGHINALK